MKMFDREELEAFKKNIDLRAYAAGLGFELDRKESSRGSSVMRHATGDKIIISRKLDGHFTYWSPRDDGDRGTIIDFVARRKGLNLGAVRKELRPFIGGSITALPTYSTLSPTSKDRLHVEMEFSKMHDALRHPYLENERGITAELLSQERFAGRIRIDASRGNAVFPHFDQNGLCGFEKKNAGFTGFSSGGTKGLWLSNSFPTDERLVFCESAIDALSHALLFPTGTARYASLGGKLNPSQPELIRAAIARMPADAEIVAAMDADQAGRDLAEIVGRAVALSGRADICFRIQEPNGAKDWNDLLRARRAPLVASSRQPEARPA
jgi:hypothetical protein